MKFTLLLTTALLALFVTGCSPKEEAASPAGPAAAAGPRTIELTANDSMKYNMNSISLAVGEEVRLSLINIGSMPKQAMAHNLVVLKAGSDTAAFATAAAASIATEYIPASLAGEVIAHTKMLGPKQTDSIVVKFTEAGEYPFLCSFPAHYQVGMKGVITVR
jgi:azurin